MFCVSLKLRGKFFERLREHGTSAGGVSAGAVCDEERSISNTASINIAVCVRWKLFTGRVYSWCKVLWVRLPSPHRSDTEQKARKMWYIHKWRDERERGELSPDKHTRTQAGRQILGLRETWSRGRTCRILIPAAKIDLTMRESLFQRKRLQPFLFKSCKTPACDGKKCFFLPPATNCTL